jgi:hypothetical protein
MQPADEENAEIGDNADGTGEAAGDTTGGNTDNEVIN